MLKEDMKFKRGDLVVIEGEPTCNCLSCKKFKVGLGEVTMSVLDEDGSTLIHVRDLYGTLGLFKLVDVRLANGDEIEKYHLYRFAYV